MSSFAVFERRGGSSDKDFLVIGFCWGEPEHVNAKKPDHYPGDLVEAWGCLRVRSKERTDKTGRSRPGTTGVREYVKLMMFLLFKSTATKHCVPFSFASLHDSLVKSTYWIFAN